MRYPAAEKLEIIRLVETGVAHAGADRHPQVVNRPAPDALIGTEN
jgi:hypothetical protein